MTTVVDRRRVTVAMLGARMHYAVPRLLHEAGLLERFFTDSYIGNKPLLRAMLQALPRRLAEGAVRRWLGREDARLPPACVTSFETLGLRYAMARRRATTHEEMERVFTTTARCFNSAILRRLPEATETVWGFNTAALELFETVKRNGVVCILEQTILPRRLEAALLAARRLTGCERSDNQDENRLLGCR